VSTGEALHDHAVAGGGQQRPVQAQLPQAVAQVGQPPRGLACAVMDAHTLGVAGAVQPQRRVQAPRGRRSTSRARSCGSRSVSTPVSAATSAVFAVVDVPGGRA
jgi:hypothetical protein